MVKKIFFSVIIFGFLFKTDLALGNANVTTLGSNTTLCLNVASTIGDIVISEGNAGDFGPTGNNYTYIISAPSGFEFDVTAGVTADNFGGTELTGISVLFKTATSIGITYSVTATASNNDKLRIRNIKVFALALGTGNITKSGGQSVSGISDNSTNHGTLTTAYATSPALSLAGSPNPTCTASGLVTLVGAPSGGTYSGTGVNNATSSFNPATAGAGTHHVKYSIGACASDTVGMDIFVYASPAVTMTSSDANNIICAGTLVTFTAYGANTYEFFKNNTSLGAPSSTNTYSSSSLANGDIIKVVGTLSNCSATSTPVTMTVNPLPTPANFNPSQATFSTSSPAFQLDTLSPTATPAGGTFSGTGVSGNLFYPNVAGPGTHTITYTYTVNGCSTTDTKDFLVGNANSVITNLNPQYCITNSKSTISVSAANIPLGWSLHDFYYFNGATDVYLNLGANNFDPASIGSLANGGTGIKTIYYRIHFDAIPGFILTWGSQDTRINPIPTVGVSTRLDFYSYFNYLCQNTPDSTLVGIPAGGTFSSSGTPGFIYSPSPGVYKCNFGVSGNLYPSMRTIRYDYTDPSTTCSNNTSISLYVLGTKAVPTVVSPSLPICSGEDPGVLTANIEAGFYTRWYRKSYSMTLPVKYVYETGTTSTYNPGPMFTTDTFYVTQEPYYGYCESNFSSPLVVTVKQKATVSANIDQTICETSTATLAGVKGGSANAVPITWTRLGDGTFNDPTLLNAVYTPGTNDKITGIVKLAITTNDPDGAGGCTAVSDSMNIILKPKATVSAGADITLCAGSTIQLNGSYGGAATSASWSGGGGIASFSPDIVTLNATYLASLTEKTNSLPITLTLTTNVPNAYCPAATDQVTINISPAALINAGSDQAICAGSTINLTGSSTKGNLPYAAKWSTDGTGNIANINNLATTYSPSGTELANGDTLLMILSANDPDGPTGPCTSVKDTFNLIIRKLPIPVILGLNAGYCKSVNAVPLNGNYGQTVFSGSFVTSNGVGGYNFLPSSAPLGSYTITYTYTDNYGCVNDTTQQVQVYAVPVANLSITGFCENTPIPFTDLSTIANPSITKWRWVFSDGVDTLTQNFTREFPAGSQAVALTVTSQYGCTDTKNVPFVIGPYPKAKFNWTEICSIDTVHFHDLSTISAGSFASWEWDFGVTSLTTDTSFSENPKYHYSAVGPYTAKLKITSNKGCADSINHVVSILPSLNPSPNSPYAQSFNNSYGYWAADGVNPSWQWGSTLGKDSINNGTKAVWVTDTAGSYNVDEKSYLNGPCLNFQYLDRPMIVLKIWSATQTQIAGAILQSSVDGGASWTLEGKVGEGVNWYDASSVIGNPGNQLVGQYAWTGQYGGWRIAKLGLDHLHNKPSVRLRLAFGSSSNIINLTDGIALDSVWIGDKNKIVLLEHFTNYSTAACKTANDSVNSTISKRSNSVFAIQYHTSFPNFDPMNQQNTADPSARVLYYGVSQAPQTILDGNYYSGNTYGSGAKLSTDDVDARTLENAKFALSLNTISLTDSIIMNAKLTNLLPVTDDLVMHLAVVERVVTAAELSPAPGGTSAQYEWVLKKMLPDAAGTYLPSRTWLKDDSALFYQAWHYNPSEVYDASQLGVVAFIQNVTTKEIYQTIYSFGTDSVGGTVNGIYDAENELKAHVYPNPASDLAFVMFNKKVFEDFDWEIYDQLGKVIESGKLRKGSEGIAINTSNYPSALYVVKIASGKNLLYTKLLVVH